MPQKIEHIDAIARRKGHGVLFLDFAEDKSILYDYENDQVRHNVLEELTKMNISWFPCAAIASDDILMDGYLGQIYLDVPYDPDDLVYRKFEAFLEYPDGSMRFPTVRFFFLSLKLAIENAHHDKIGHRD